MSIVDILLPAMGEGITDATITRWLVKVGDTVEVDQSLAEVATDKVDSEIPSPVAGKVKELIFAEGEVPQIGKTIAIIEVEGEEVEKKSSEKSKSFESEPLLKVEDTTSKPQLVESSNLSEPFKYYSPLVRSVATKEGIPLKELESIKGTGLHNRITRNDITAYIETRNRITEVPKQVSLQSSGENAGTNVEIIQMDRMRKLIAQHMVASKQTSAHVTSFIEVDVTNMVNWRNANKDEFLKREGEKLTLTPFFVEAAAKAIKEFPLINSSVDGDKILVKKNVNIGIATALPNGNLIVPVIKDADNLNLVGLSARINDLAQRARNSKLQPDEIQGGTFTITNLGMFETFTGTPIINQPQVAILAIGAIAKRVVVVETELGDTIGIRQMSMLSLSYDHRVVDGALSGMFLKAVRDNLQNFQPYN